MTGSVCVGQLPPSSLPVTPEHMSLVILSAPPTPTPSKLLGVVSQEEVGSSQEGGWPLPEVQQAWVMPIKGFSCTSFSPELTRELTLPGYRGWNPGALALCKDRYHEILCNLPA